MTNALETKLRVSLLSAVLFGLSACGGGAGDDGEEVSVPVALSVTKQISLDTVQENNKATLVFIVENAKGAIRVTDESVSNPKAPATGTIQTEGNKVTYVVSAAESKISNGQYLVALTLSDDNRSVKASHTLAIENVSGKLLQSKLTSLKEASVSFVSLAEEKLLFAKLEDVAKLLNQAYFAHEPAMKGKIAAALSETESRIQIDSWINKVTTALSSYSAGIEQEEVLSDLVIEANSVLNARTVKANQAISELLTYIQDAIPPLPLGNVFISDNGQSLSQFKGNTTLGAYADGKWAYYPNYKFLAAITTKETNTCNAQ